MGVKSHPTKKKGKKSNFVFKEVFGDSEFREE
jgi:hypothetical protein